MSTNIIDSIKLSLAQQEKAALSPFATLSKNGIRRLNEYRIDSGYRQNFSIDADRILHSLAYTRYIDKTQVFYLIHNDHITHRVLHVQLVSKIARTIGRLLGLNEDLIESIAIGHDIGHAPFGHEGENILSQICISHKTGHFLHNVQSVQFLDKVEQKGKGSNLCLQTLDGILCHDGEIHNQKLIPEKKKTFEIFEKELDGKKKNNTINLTPMTMEGCVVRMADTISYIGRDIEDAIRLNLIKRSDMPYICTHLLGQTNGSIVYNLVTDIVVNSFQKNHISFSPEISNALKILKEFNLKHIYLNPKIKNHLTIIKQLFKILFERYLTDLETENKNSVIFTNYLSDMSKEYIKTHSNKEIIRDFIAGMTDKYFLRQFPSYMRPKPINNFSL